MTGAPGAAWQRSPAEQTAYRDRSERMASSPSSTGRKNGAVTIAGDKVVGGTTHQLALRRGRTTPDIVALSMLENRDHSVTEQESRLRHILPFMYETTNDRYNKAVWAVPQHSTVNKSLDGPRSGTAHPGSSVTFVPPRSQSPSAWNRMNEIHDGAVGVPGMRDKSYPLVDGQMSFLRRQMQRESTGRTSIKTFDMDLPAGPNSWERSVCTSPVGGLKWRLPVLQVHRHEISGRQAQNFQHTQGPGAGLGSHTKTSMPFCQSWFNPR